MDIELLKREVEKHGLNATSKKYNIKKNKIKELINLNNKDIIDNTMSCNITNNTSNKATDKHTMSSNMMSLSNDEIKQLKLLIKNSNDILKLLKKDTIKLKDNKTTVTSIRLNLELLHLVKDYSKKNNITLTNIINNALIDFLKNNSK